MSETKFALPEVASIDEVPDEYRAFYFEKDGKVVRQNPAALASTLAKIKRENEKLANEAAERDAVLRAYKEALGDDADPEVVKKLKEKASRADQLPSNDEVEKRIRMVEENYKKQIGLKEKDLSEYEAIVQNELVNGTLREALKSVDANADGLDILPDMLRKRVEIQKLGAGRIKLIPLDKDGTRMYAPDGSDATLLDLVNEVRNDRPIFFNGTRATGLGSGGEAVSVPKDAKNWWKMTDSERIEFQKKHPDKVAALIGSSGPPPASSF